MQLNKLFGFRSLLISGVGVLGVTTLFAIDIPLTNWEVPQRELSKETDITPAVPFVGIQPCRLVDTRPASGFPAAWGAPALVQNATRDFDLNSAPHCPGIPANVDAYSINVTVAEVAAPGDIRVWPQGNPPPVATSVQNWTQSGPTFAIANAIIVAAGTGGGVTVQMAGSTGHLLIDINGYFSDVPGTPGNFFRLQGNVPSPNGIIVGENSNTGFFAAGILGRITSTSPSAGSAGIRGINNGTGPSGVGVWGSQAGSGWGVHGEALGTTGSGSKGVFGTSASSADGSVGVHGLAEATTGRTYGVLGDINSEANNAAGVLGVDGSGLTAAVHTSAGVRGESAAHSGVQGVSRVNGVHGSLVNSAGDGLAGGFLGRDLGANNYGVFSFGDYGGSGAKFFVEPHPERADMVIRYVALEGPESGTYFRGKGKFQNGIATIEVPEDFRLVTDDEGLSVQVTPIGGMASVGVLRIGLDAIVVQGSRNLEFFYLVNGVRRSHRHLKAVGPGQEYMPETPESTIPAYLTEVQKEMLVSNGTYKADGTVNMETAKALGWTKVWEKRSKNVEKKSGTVSRKQGED